MVGSVFTNLGSLGWCPYMILGSFFLVFFYVTQFFDDLILFSLSFKLELNSSEDTVSLGFDGLKYSNKAIVQ